VLKNTRSVPKNWKKMGFQVAVRSGCNVIKKRQLIKMVVVSLTKE